jgi:hypothetical protein
MNKDMEINHKPGIAYGDYKLGKEMWGSIEPFDYQLPDPYTILISQKRSLGAILTWLFGLFLIASFYAPKIPKL